MEKVAEILRHKRHDYLNHLQVILGYLQLNKLDKVKDYIIETSGKLVEEGQLFQKLSDEIALSVIEFQRLLYIKGCEVKVVVSASLPEGFDSAEGLTAFLEEFATSCQIPIGAPCELLLEFQLDPDKNSLVLTFSSSSHPELVQQAATLLGDKELRPLTEKENTNFAHAFENGVLKMFFPME